MFRFIASVAAFALALPLPAGDGTRQRVEVTHTDTLHLAPGGTVRIDGSFGDLNIEGWERPEVELTVVKTTEFSVAPKEREKAAALLNRYRVAAKNSSPSEVTISTALPSRSLTRPLRGRGAVEMEYRIHVPRETKLVIHHSTGQVAVVNVNADIDATSRVGDILVMLPEQGVYSIDAHSSLGGIVSDFAGSDHRAYWLSERLASTGNPSARRIRLRVGAGGITIKKLIPRNWMAGLSK